MKWQLRIAQRNDIPAITRIYNQAIAAQFQTADTSPVDEANRSAWFAEHDAKTYPIYVAEQIDDGVVGYLSISAYRPGRAALRHTAEISYYVATEHQGQGIGTALVSYALEQAPTLDIKTLFAILLDANSDSVKLLEKHGFEQWGHLPKVADFDGVEVGHLYYGRRIAQ